MSMDNLPEVIGIGEILWDECLLPGGRKSVRLGGAPANFAFHVQQQGISSCVVSAIGEDTPGRALVGMCYALGLQLRLSEEAAPTGRVRAQVDAAGVPEYSILPDVAWDYLQMDDATLEYARHARAVCFGTLAQRSLRSREAIRAFLRATNADCLRIFDVNLRGNFYDAGVLRDSMQLANVLKLNEQELPIITQLEALEAPAPAEAARALMERYALRELILTCGTGGSYVFADGGREHSFLPTPEVQVVDTVGAGDSFLAAYMAGRLRGQSVAQAHAAAVALAAEVCTRAGAMPGMEELAMG